MRRLPQCLSAVGIRGARFHADPVVHDRKLPIRSSNGETDGYITTIGSAVGEGLLEQYPGGSKPSEQNQDQNYNEHEAEPTATVVAGPVEGAAPEAAEASE